MAIKISSFYVYRWRYQIGYGIAGLILIGMLFMSSMYIPGGLSNSEISSVIKSSNISLGDISSYAVTNMPYHLLQKASLYLFGVSTLSIKLPSLILGVLSAIGLILLLNRWFKKNIAVLGSILALTTGQFLFISQSGSPAILYIFWSIMLLLLATLIARRERPKTLWKILFFVAAALSLYTPLSVYALLALGLATAFHPHLRYLVRQLSRVRILVGMLIGVIALIPLVYALFKTPSVLLSILGIPSSWPDAAVNIPMLFHQYLDFATPSSTTLMTPVFGLGSMLIIGFGLYKLIVSRQSAQSHIILFWLACLVPIVIITPLYTSVTFLPLVLLLSTGLDSLLGHWYRLFPRNPYARITGLLPLIVLVIALVWSGLERYAYGYYYSPSAVSNFSQDLKLLPKDTHNLVVTNAELPFYSVIAKYDKTMTVELVAPTKAAYTTTRDARPQSGTHQIETIITSQRAEQADRFYVYKN